MKPPPSGSGRWSARTAHHRRARDCRRRCRGPRVVVLPRGRIRPRARFRPQRPPHHHRHAARGRDLGVRRTREHTAPRCARRPRRPLHLRPRARGRHLAVAHEPPDRHVPVRARRARQQRLSGQGRQHDAGRETQEPRFRHRRVRRRLPSRPALRPERRFRRLRRSHRRDRQHSGLRPPRTARRRRRVVRARLDWGAIGQVVRVGARLRSARTVRAARRVRPALPQRPVRGRGRLDRLRPRRPVRSARRAAAQDARHRHRGSWREPGRPRRVDARHLRLRADAASAAHRCGARGDRRDPTEGSPSMRRCATSTSCRRFSKRSARRRSRHCRARRSSR